MLRRAISSFRQVLPPAKWILIVAAGYLLPWVAAWLVRHLLDPSDWALDSVWRMLLESFTHDAGSGQALWLTIAAGAYGVWRVAAYHPATGVAYYQWLKLTPWRAGQPLPLGPIALAWPDAIIVGALLILMLPLDPGDLPFLSPVLAFATVSLLWLCGSFMVVGQRGVAYLILAGVSCNAMSFIPPLVLLGIDALLMAIAMLALRTSMRRFPWDEVAMRTAHRKMKPGESRELKREGFLGWPFQYLSPRPPQLHITVPDGLAVSLIAGLWSFTLLSRINPGDLDAIAGDASYMLVCGIVVLTLIRIGAYVFNHRPPISLLGRLLTGRWIIPDYDVVVILPLALGAACCTFVVYARAAGWSILWVFPTAVSLAVMSLTCVGPSLGRWSLTCPTRIAPFIAQKSEFTNL